MVCALSGRGESVGGGGGGECRAGGECPGGGGGGKSVRRVPALLVLPPGGDSLGLPGHIIYVW